MNTINKQVSSVVIIPDELEKWYHLLNYIRVNPDRRMYRITLRDHYGMKGIEWNFNKVYTVEYICEADHPHSNQWVAQINEDVLPDSYDYVTLKNIVSIEPVIDGVEEPSKRVKLGSAVATATATAPVDKPEEKMQVEPSQPQDSTDTNTFKFQECMIDSSTLSRELNVNSLPSHIEMTDDQLQLVKRYMNLLATFGCPIIKQPTLHQDAEHAHRWYVLLITHKDRGFKWYCSPKDAKAQLERDNSQKEPEPKSELKYRDVNEYKDCSTLDVAVISMFLQALKMNFFDTPSINWGSVKPVLKIVFQSKSIAWLEMHYLDNFAFYDSSAYYTHSIKYILTEWDEPIDITPENFDMDFLCHRIVLKYSWSIITGGWFNNAPNNGVPSLYYMFKTVFAEGDECNKFVDSIGKLDFILRAIKYELDHTTTVPEEQSRLINICLELIPLYFENHEDESEYMHKKRIGYTLKQTMTTWFDNLMSLACQYHVSINAAWAADYVKRVLNIFDIRWMLDNFIIWSESSFHSHQHNWVVRAFNELDQSKLTKISRDNLAIIKSIIANHHYPKEAMLQLAKSQTYNYVKRYELLHKAGFNFAANFEFSKAAYTTRDVDAKYVQFLQSVGAKTISLSLVEILSDHDRSMLTLLCLQTTPETVFYQLLDVCSDSQDDMSAKYCWGVNELIQMKPIIASMKVTNTNLRQVKNHSFLRFLIDFQGLLRDSAWMNENGVTSLDCSTLDIEWLKLWLFEYISQHRHTDIQLVFHANNVGIRSIADDVFVSVLGCLLSVENQQKSQITFVKNMFEHLNYFFAVWRCDYNTAALLKSYNYKPMVDALYANEDTKTQLQNKYKFLDAMLQA